MNENILRIHFRNFADKNYTFEQFKVMISEDYTIKTAEEYNSVNTEKNKYESELNKLQAEKNSLSQRCSSLESEKYLLEIDLASLKSKADEQKRINTIRYP